MTTDTYKWAVFNRETGKIATTKESRYSRKAYFTTREEARSALREGRVYTDPTKGKVDRVALS